jgi:phospholipase/lecithinase/hemolysin
MKMRATTLIKAIGGAVLTASALTPASAQYTKLVVFGDSMSDTHRLFEFSKLVFGRGFPAPPNLPGRVCDGPVAVEYLADNLKVPLLDYAFAGATSSYDTLLLVPFGMLTQVNEYLNSNAIVPTIKTLPVLGSLLSKVPGTGHADPKALHMIWTGPDDFYRPLIGMTTATSAPTVANIKLAVTTLYNSGARYFFIPLMPDLSLTPSAQLHEKQSKGYVDSARQCSDNFAVLLGQGLEELRQRYPDAHIMSHDTLSFMRTQFAKGKAEGKNITQACRTGGLDVLTFKTTPATVCTDVENRVFWDGNHPTSWVDKILADEWAPMVTVQP